MNAELKKNLLGEFIGTFFLVFFGCASVAGAVVLQAYSGGLQVALMWGLGLAVAIYLCGGLSGGHFNPAVTIAMAVYRKFPCRKVLPYILTQLVAGFVASCILYTVFSGAIRTYESKNSITRGASGSEATAMIFGEYFPNPAGKALTGESPAIISESGAIFAEFVGTAIFVLVIMGVTDPKNSQISPLAAPAIIGLTLALLIAIFGPLTMGCLNPARDFGPRLFTAINGWGSIPFSVNGLGWFTVYIFAPILGALAGGRVYSRMFKPSF